MLLVTEGGLGQLLESDNYAPIEQTPITSRIRFVDRHGVIRGDCCFVTQTVC